MKICVRYLRGLYVRFDGASWRVMMQVVRFVGGHEWVALHHLNIIGREIFVNRFFHLNGASFHCVLFLVKFVAVHDHGKIVVFSYRRVTLVRTEGYIDDLRLLKKKVCMDGGARIIRVSRL